MTLGVERGGGGAFVSRNYNSILSAQGEGEWRGHEGHLSLGKMILSIEPGRLGGGGGGGGSFSSRNNSSNCRTMGGGIICLFLSVESGTQGHLSLGIMILCVEPVICL